MLFQSSSIWTQIFAYENLDVIFTIIFLLIGMYIFHRSWGFIRSEMKTAPKKTTTQKLRYYLSNFFFSGVVSVVVMFVLALITTTFSVNASYAIIGEETVWNDRILGSLAFPRFLPITLFILTGYAVLYPFIEYINMARQVRDTPTDVQKYLEYRVIDRVNPPFTYFIALGLFFLVIILVPLGISYITLNFSQIPNSNLSSTWIIGLIFVDWLLIGPIFYLSYYGKLGTAHFFHQGLRAGIRIDFKAPLLFIIAIISIISTVYGFIDYIAILWGRFPESTTNPADNSGGFLHDLILQIAGSFLSVAQIDQLKLILIAIPIDFVLFILTTVFFGLYGFVSKFLKKEPLNRASLVLFATYLITGIGFTIFVNIMIKWPYIFPNSFISQWGFNLNLSNPADQSILIRLLSPALLMEKLFNLVFIIYFVFINKEIRKNTDELVLNKAILKQNLKTISNYTKHQNPEMRRLVAHSIVYYLRIKSQLDPKQMKYLAQIIGDILQDPDPSVMDIIIEKYPDIKTKFTLDAQILILKTGLSSELHKNIDKLKSIIIEMGMENIQDFTKMFQSLIIDKISDPAKLLLFDSLRTCAKGDWNYIINNVLPLLGSPQPIVNVGVLQLINENLANIEDKYEDIVQKCRTLLTSPNQKTVLLALEVYATIGGKNFEYIPGFIDNFMRLDLKNQEIVHQGIGALAKVIVDFPVEFERVFVVMERLYTSKSNEIQLDFALSLGSIGAAITTADLFYTRIYPYLAKLIEEKNTTIRKAVFSSLALIGKTRPDIAMDDRFFSMFQKLIVDPDHDLHHSVHEYLLTFDEERFIGEMISLLQKEIELELRIDILNHLVELAHLVVKYLEKYNIIQVLLAQDFEKQTIPISTKKGVKQLIQSTPVEAEIKGIETFETPHKEKIEETEGEKAKNLFAGYILEGGAIHRKFIITTEIPDIKVSVVGATIALLTQIAIYSNTQFESMKAFIASNLEKKDDLVCAKTIDFFTQIGLNGQLITAFGYTIEYILDYLSTNIKKAGPLTINALAFSLYELQNHYLDQHGRFFELIIDLEDDIKYIEPHTIKYMLLAMASLISNNPDEYFRTGRRKRNGKYYFEDVLIPFISKHLQSPYREIQEGITLAIEKIAKAERQERFFRKFLMTNLNTSQSHITKTSLLHALSQFPDVITDTPIQTAIIENINHKDPNIQIAAIQSLGKIIQKFDPFTAQDLKKSGKTKEFQRFKKLMFEGFVKTYNKSISEELKFVILEEFKPIILAQPESVDALRLIKEMGIDPDPDVAYEAVSIFFEFISKYPNKFDDTTDFWRYYANTRNTAIGKLIARKLEEFYKMGKESDIFIPVLLELASQKTKEVRELALEDFRTIYYNEPKKLLEFFAEILKLTRNRDPEIREDAALILFDILFTKSDLVKDHEELFAVFRYLHNDQHLEVRQIVAEHLYRLVDLYPEEISEILNLSYSFLQESDNFILQNAGFTLKVIALKSEENYNEIRSTLDRLYKKNQNAKIMTLIQELDSEMKRAKEHPGRIVLKKTKQEIKQRKFVEESIEIQVQKIANLFGDKKSESTKSSSDKSNVNSEDHENDQKPMDIPSNESKTD